MDVARRRPRSRRVIGIGASAAAALAITTLALSSLAKAPPAIERDAVWIDRVQRGPFVRRVRGSGALVAESVRWTTARSPGVVEQRLIEPGAQVEPETILLMLENPDLRLQALEAERDSRAAEATLAQLRSTLQLERLERTAALSSTRLEWMEAKRQVALADALAQHGAIATLEHARARDRAKQLAVRLATEQQYVRVLVSSTEARLSAELERRDHLLDLARYRAEQVQALQVKAGASGVLQELVPEVGQRVSQGEQLATIADVTKLRARLRIAENDIDDVRAGAPATIDTHEGLVEGKVVRVDPAVKDGLVAVDVSLDARHSAGLRPDLSVEGEIEIERLDDALYVGRPAQSVDGGRLTLFKLDDKGSEAVRTVVELGSGSAQHIVVKSGLSQNDQVVLSDMTKWLGVERVQLR